MWVSLRLCACDCRIHVTCCELRDAGSSSMVHNPPGMCNSTNRAVANATIDGTLASNASVTVAVVADARLERSENSIVADALAWACMTSLHTRNRE